MCIKKQLCEEDYSDKVRIAELFEFYNEELYENTEENRKINAKITKIEKPFYESLTNIQKQQFEEVIELHSLNSSVTDKKIFIFAFRLAISLILESK